jgi:hypothetical protein
VEDDTVEYYDEGDEAEEGGAKEVGSLLACLQVRACCFNLDSIWWYKHGLLTPGGHHSILALLGCLRDNHLVEITSRW